MVHIIKRKGHKQEFDERKIYASTFAACLSASLQQEEAELVASKVSEEIKDWIKDKDEVTSKQIFDEAHQILKRLNKNAALMYSTLKDVS